MNWGSSAGKIVIGFFWVVLGILALGLIIVGVTFLIASSKNSKSDTSSNDLVYKKFSNKGYIFRFCYGVCVAADTFLQGIEVAATALGIFIVLMPDADNAMIAILLMISFIATTIQNALKIKNCRIAYAKAFRIMEFAMDEYYISGRTSADKEKLIEANKKAQNIIEVLLE